MNTYALFLHAYTLKADGSFKRPFVLKQTQSNGKPCICCTPDLRIYLTRLCKTRDNSEPSELQTTNKIADQSENCLLHFVVPLF